MLSHTLRTNILSQADRAAPDPYKPATAFARSVGQLVDEGVLVRNQLGGFSITPQGERELAAMRARRHGKI